MSIPAARVGADQLAVYATFSDPWRGYSLQQMAQALSELGALLQVGAIVDMQAAEIERLREFGLTRISNGDYDRERGLLGLSPSLVILRQAVLVEHEVLRLSYASPLDVWLAGTQVASGALLTGRGAIYLFERFQAARVAKHSADLRVAALDVLKNSLIVDEKALMKVGATGLPGESQADAVAAKLDAAAKALTALDTLEFRPRRDIRATDRT